MFANPLVIPTLILAVALFILGQKLARRVRHHRLWLFALALLCLPGFSFAAVYLHLVREPLWYLQFRSLPAVEMLAASWGMFFGFLAADWLENRAVRYRLLAFALLLAFVPFAKSIMLPVEWRGRISDKWQEDVCLQDGSLTCGPASLATILRYYGLPTTQREVAMGSFACARSTENWYLARYTRKCGLRARYLYERRLDRIPTPAILGTGTERAGHFVVLFSAHHGQVSIGDPLHGRLTMSEGKFLGGYGFHGFAISVTKE